MNQTALISIDTEFRQTQEKFVQPVCVSLRYKNQVKTWWYDEIEDFKRIFTKYVEDGYMFVSFMSVAEYRFLLSIGFTRDFLKKVKMIDVYPMWRILLNSLSEYNYGNYVVNDGIRKTIITTHKPEDGAMVDGEWYTDAEGNEYMYEDIKTRKYSPSLAHCCMRVLDVDISSEHKDRMRDIILKGDHNKHKEDIKKYCESDTIYLERLAYEIDGIIKKYNSSYRGVGSYGKYCLDCAVIENTGIPISGERLTNFMSNYNALIYNIVKECNNVQPFFVWDDKAHKFVRSYKLFEQYIDSLNINWERTKSLKYKQDKDTLKNAESLHPILKLNNTMTALREVGYFSPTRSKNILVNIGSDGRIRASTMPYGAKTSRNQPRPTNGFILLMSRWIRNLVDGTIIGGDYASQEIYLQGILSDDKNFIEAYKNGDPYIWFAKKCGSIPNDVFIVDGLYTVDNIPVSKDLQIKYKADRNVYKQMLLGVGYGMGENSLALRLTAARLAFLSKEEKENAEIVSKLVIAGKDKCYPYERRAVSYLDNYKKIFKTYDQWKWDVLNFYKKHNYLNLSDGWCIIGNETKSTTVKNFLVQGEASVILRKAVSLCLDNGLIVVATLHDAIYIDCDGRDKVQDMIILEDCMKKAVSLVLELEDTDIRIDIHEQIIDWDNFTSTWSDGKGYEEFKQFGKYFLTKK